MAITLNTNLPSLFAANQLDKSSDNFQRSIERLSSGKQITRPGDDPSGLAISSGIDTEVSSLQAAQRNVQDARSLFQVSENGLNQIGDMLVRMRELALMGAKDWSTDEERDAIQSETSQLHDEIDRTAKSTRYRGISLLNGDGGELQLQVGPGTSDLNRVSFDASDIDATAGHLGIDGVDLSDSDSSLDSLETIDSAIKQVQAFRSVNGGHQARMNSILEGLKSKEDVLTADSSRIKDVDVAKEASEMMKHQLAQNAQIAVMAQANSLNQSVLRLLQPNG